MVCGAIAAVALSALVVPGNAWPASDDAFQSAWQSFARASAGDDSAIDTAVAAFEALHKAEPANPVVMAYAGASIALQARTALAPLQKMSLAEDGLARIDSALATLTSAHDAPIERGTPGSLEVRFVAANTFLAVPSFMNRAARGKKLLNEVLASPLFEKTPLPFQGSVWLRAAELAAKEQRTDDARQYLHEIVSRNAPQASRARDLLKAPAP
jgi:hypothetical protein